MKCLYNKQGGFTLLELVITIGILGIIMVPLSGLFNQVYLSDQNSWSRIQTLNVAQKVMEDAMSGSISGDYQPPQGYAMQISQSDVSDIVGLKKIQIKVYPENTPQLSVVLTAYTTNDVSYTPPVNNGNNGGGQNGQKNGDFYKWLKAHTDTFNTIFIVILTTYLAFVVFGKQLIIGLIAPDFKRAYDDVTNILYNQFYNQGYNGVIKNVDLAQKAEEIHNLSGANWEIVKTAAQFLDRLREIWNAWFS